MKTNSLERISKTVVTPECFNRESRTRRLDSRLRRACTPKCGVSARRRAGMTITPLEVFLRWPLVMILISALFLSLCPAQVNVPLKYKLVYDTYVAGLKRYNAYLDRNVGNQQNAVAFGAELLAANSNRGEALLEQRALRSIEITLDRFKEMGLRGVTVAIGYPILTDDAPHSKEYLDFYKSVAEMVHKKGMILCVKLHVLFSGTVFSPVKTDFSKLTIEMLAKQKRLMAERVIAEMAPEYLTLGGEPDTEAKLIGNRKLNDPENYSEMVRTILKDLKKGNTLVGVGQGTWGTPAFAKAYARTDIDFINIHVYPFGKKVLDVLNQIIATAKESNKRLILDECWLYKMLPGEGGSIAASAEVYRRDIYSFWEPADELFLESMAKMASQSNIEYLSPFWSHCFFAHRDYDPADEKLSYQELNVKFLPEVSHNMVSGEFSKTGSFYSDLIKKYGGGGSSK